MPKCKKCGKELNFTEKLLGRLDDKALCSDCFNAENKPHCLECGKELPWASGSDLCFDCEFKVKSPADGVKSTPLAAKSGKSCKKCGKKLTFFNTPSDRMDICLDCFNEEKLHRIREENKGRKGYCKGCGKSLPLTPRLNLDKSGYLRDLCKDCEIKCPTKVNAKYIGGYGAYPDPEDVKIKTYPDHLEVPELGLTIPYNQLQNVQSMTEEKL
jgi:hypothetical protein